METAYSIINSTAADMEIIFRLFDFAIEYQKKNGYDLWPQFSREIIETEIKEQRHWKIVHNTSIACIFSVLYNDSIIWGTEKDKDPAIYLHRITTAPSFKGMGIMSIIKEWAIGHARSNQKRFVRMDTWGNNENLRKYYIACGFNYIGQQHLIQAEGFPAHYGGPVLSLFEIEVN